MSLINLSISRKLGLAFAGVVTIILVMGAVVLVSLNGLRSSTLAAQDTRQAIAAAEATLNALVEQQNAVRGFVATGDESFIGKVETQNKAIQTSVADLSRLAPGADQQSKIATLKTAIAKVQGEEQGQIAARRDAAQRASALSSLATVGRLTDSRAALTSLVTPMKAELDARAITETTASRTASWALVGGGLLAALLAAAMGWMLSRAIAKPITSMTAAMTTLAAGNNDIAVPGAGRRDEIGRMADAVEAFRTAAIERLAMQATADEQRQMAEQTRTAADAERTQTTAEQAQVVDAVATGLEKLSGGLLVYRISEAFAPAYEKLRGDFNAAMQRLQDDMRIVAGNTAGVRSASGEISQASDDLSRRTEQQAASLEETAAALDQITATVRKTAQGAGQARQMVATAKSDAERSSEVVTDAISAMGEIEGSARQISQIIGVIDEIAFQTNLLALNAGVEAARAGDAGKGFAVVASEVRALAQRSAEAAKEIKTLISASSQQVDRGVNLVGETGKALERIVAQVAEINGVVAEIAASAEEQATGLQQVNTAVNQMDQVTQQNAAMVEQATAASHTLTGEAEQLSKLISRFDLGQDGLETARTAPAPARAHAPVPALRTTAQPRAEAHWDES